MTTTIVSLQAALEARLNSLSPALPIAWENVVYAPTDVDAPYQRVNILPGESQNNTFGGGGTELVMEVGIFQVRLYYPSGTGRGHAAARADLIRDHFPRGLAMAAGGITVIVQRTPSVAPALEEGDWYVLPVSIPYFANVVA